MGVGKMNKLRLAKDGIHDCLNCFEKRFEAVQLSICDPTTRTGNLQSVGRPCLCARTRTTFPFDKYI